MTRSLGLCLPKMMEPREGRPLATSAPAEPDFGRERFSPSGLIDPYPIYARLREQPGLAYSPSLDLWLVSRYEDVSQALRTPERYSSRNILRPSQPRPPEVQAFLEANSYRPSLQLLGDDPPDHGRMRGLVSRAFTPQVVTELEPRIRAWIDELLDARGAQGSAGPADVVAELAVPLPMRVMCELIGVPAADMARVKDSCQAAAQFSTGRFGPAEHLECAHKVVAYRRYVRELVEAKQGAPGPDLISALLAASEGDGTQAGARLSREEVVSMCILFIFAGHQTTTDLITNALLHLIPRPELWRALAGDAALCARAVEEVLRYDAPVQGMLRSVGSTEPVSLAGTELRPGSRLLLLFAAANRDPAIFAEPERFDVDRKSPEPHLGFGRGIHFCLGASLARMEAKLVLMALSRRFPSAQLDNAPLGYAPNLVHRAPHRLAVAWHGAEAGRADEVAKKNAC